MAVALDCRLQKYLMCGISSTFCRAGCFAGLELYSFSLQGVGVPNGVSGAVLPFLDLRFLPPVVKGPLETVLMLQNDKFLSIGVQIGKIKPDSIRIALQNQKQRRLNQEHVLVGDILVNLGLLTNSSRDEILTEQTRRRAAPFHRLKRLTPAPSLVGQRLLIVILATLSVVVAWKLKVPLELATGIAGFALVVAITILEYRALHLPTLSFIRALMLCGALFVLMAFLYAVFTFFRLNEIAELHAAPDSRAVVTSWLFRVKLGFLAMAAMTVALTTYSLWKFHGLRYTQARLGLMKDVIIRVEESMRDKTKAIEDQQAEAIMVVLKGLRNAIRLSLPDRTLRRFTVFFPGRDQITVMYFVPEPLERSFRLMKVAYPEDAPEKVRDGFAWMQQHHTPTFLDRDGFENMVRLAKGVNSKGWRRRYLNFPDRHELVSICGWIYATKETLFSRDASQCLAHDGRYFEGMRVAQGLTRDELTWITFGSFIACPVPSPDGGIAGVLIIAKSRNNALEPEDLEISVVASQLLGRILDGSKEEANGG